MPPATSDVPPGLLAPVVRRAISPDPALRYQSAGELLAALQVAVTPGYWEPAAQKAGRLRAQLAAGPDPGAIGEVTRWAGEAGSEDLRDLTVAISALSPWAAGDWWKQNPVSFSPTFMQFARGMRECEFQFADCDPIAEFAGAAVLASQDRNILREAVSGLAVLGCAMTAGTSATWQ